MVNFEVDLLVSDLPRQRKPEKFTRKSTPKIRSYGRRVHSAERSA